MTEVHDRKELKANWKNKVDAKVLTKQEVAKHKSKGDNWIIIHGKGTLFVRGPASLL